MHHKSGRNVSLVGWSLGGMFAMYGAHEATECVRSVITLGSPVTFDPEGSQSPPLVKALYRLISHPMGTSRAPDAVAREVPAAAEDAAGADLLHLLAWRTESCRRRRRPSTATRRCTRTSACPGSHLGLGFNPLVLWIVADRLAQPEGRWRPFEPSAGSAGRIYRLTTSYRLAPA